MPRVLALLLLVLATHLAGCRAQDTRTVPGPGDPRWSDLDREVRAFQEGRGLPGLSVAVRSGAEVVFARGYGWANVERRVPVGPDTLFPIGSIEKQFTAAAVMRLVEAGRLRLDDAITDILPELDTDGRRITVRDMLQQVSGLQDGETLHAFWSHGAAGAPPRAEDVAPLASRIRVGEGFAPGEQVAIHHGAPLYHAPGERWTYSQSNYDLMCLVIAAVSGETYYQAIERLARAAGIPFHAAWTPPPAVESATTAHGYTRTTEGLVPFWEPNTGSGWSTATGLVRWAGALASGRVVSPGSYARMTTPVRLADGREWNYGMGLVVGRFEGHREVEHTGNISGFTAILASYPDDDLSIAVQANEGYTLAASALEERIARRLLGIPDPVYRDLPLEASERRRFAGVFDAGSLWFEVLPSGDRLVFDLRDPGIEDGRWELFRMPLLYQGDGHFVGADEPGIVQVRYDPARPGEASATIAGSGWRLQGIRLPPARAAGTAGGH